MRKTIKNKIKKSDKVILIAGKDKGKVGFVTKVIPSMNKVIVEGLNKVFCFNKKEQTGVGSKEMPIHISNVAHIDPVDGKAVKVKVERSLNKVSIISKRSLQIIR